MIKNKILYVSFFVEIPLSNDSARKNYFSFQ